MSKRMIAFSTKIKLDLITFYIFYFILLSPGTAQAMIVATADGTMITAKLRSVYSTTRIHGGMLLYAVSEFRGLMKWPDGAD